MNIGILGLGTVGSGVINVIAKNKDEINKRTGTDIKVIIAAVSDLNKNRLCDTGDIKITNNPYEVINNPDIEVVIELIGGNKLARDLVEKALDNKKHVITANKALIATFGDELVLKARKNNVNLLFEGTVAGGIPIIKVLKEGLTANKITKLVGIINGTTNFIITKMQQENSDFAEVLKEAQDLGYAEADPTFDIEGIDAAHKLTILSAIAFGTNFEFDKIYIEGITKIEAEDIKFAHELGYIVKHLGIAKIVDNDVELRVHPTLIPKSKLLANVNGVMNAVVVKGNALGNTLYYGAGAGSEATASAVIADLIDIIKCKSVNNIKGWNSQNDFIVKPIESITSIYYLRILATDKPGVLSDITKTLADKNISIELVIQKQHDENNNSHIAIITNEVKERIITMAVREIEEYGFVHGGIKILRVENLD